MKKKRRVAVAMSGGVDSSVAAALLVEQGYEVIGLTMRLWSDEQGDPFAQARYGGCCTLSAVHDARQVAGVLGIRHYIVNMRDRFEETVVADFVSEYAAGRTPNPCVRCNQYIKFDLFRRRATALGAELVASGHYARAVRGPGGLWELRKGVDAAKDQSYVLYMIDQETLAHTLFPVGGFSKDEIRRRAHALGLAVADKPDSQEICFVENDDYRAFLRERRPELMRQGEIIDDRGHVLGVHQGVAFYTIGQRRGLGVAAGERLYVLRLDPATNTVVVGRDEALLKRVVSAREASWVSGESPSVGETVTAKIRYNSPAADAEVIGVDGDCFTLRFREPQRAVTPGQAVVLYDGDRVLGGGRIDRAGGGD